MPETYRWFVGIDWATESHEVCVLDRERSIVHRKTIEHSGRGIAQLVESLLNLCRHEPGQIAVAIEMPRGAIVETLVEALLAASVSLRRLGRPAQTRPSLELLTLWRPPLCLLVPIPGGYPSDQIRQLVFSPGRTQGDDSIPVEVQSYTGSLAQAGSPRHREANRDCEAIAPFRNRGLIPLMCLL